MEHLFFGSIPYISVLCSSFSPFVFKSMQGDPVKMIFFNVNGVLNVIKVNKIISKLKKERAQIALLSGDTHEAK